MATHRPGSSPLASVASLLALALLTLFTPIPAAQASIDGPPPFNGIAHIALRVKDLAASTAFYESLGFEQAFALSRDGAVYESFIKINDTQFIELYPTTPKDPEPAFLHLCFEGTDLEAINQDYRSRGLTPTAVRKAGAGNLLFTMPGPQQASGPQNIEYTQYQPGSMHTLDQGKHLGSDRIADKLVTVTLAFQDPAAARDFYINELQFKPIAGNPMFLHLPGDSGERVQIVAATVIGSRARFNLYADNTSKAARMLKKLHIPVTVIKDTKALSFTDPDGNIIVIEPN